MLYRPKAASGKAVPFNWPLVLYRRLNLICWPLEHGAGVLARIFDRFYYAFGFFIFVQHNDAELRYLRESMQNLDQMLIGVPTYLILVEIHLRSFQLGLHKKRFRRFLSKFYAEIYIDQSSEPQLYRHIQRRLLPIGAYSSLYFMTLVSYLVTAIVNLSQQLKDPLYKMIYPFDITPYYVYVPIMLSNIWVGFIVTTTIYGEDNVLAVVMLHLNARLLLLQRQLQQRTQALLQRSDSAHIASDFSAIIVQTIQENVRLHRFAMEFQQEFSYRIFVMMSFSATIICALCFKVYTNPLASSSFIFWMFAKVMEMLLIGELGSTVIATTNTISSMYYESNWELLLERSTNTQENVRLMKLILLAIGTSQKPFTLTGFNFFSVSLAAMLKILQGAGSYFTCLISLR